MACVTKVCSFERTGGIDPLAYQLRVMYIHHEMEGKSVRRTQAESRADVKRLQPIRCACTALRMAARIVSRSYDVGLAAAGMNATQYAILVNVHRYEPISQMRLATHLCLERTALYRAVEILEGRGWLTTTPTGKGVTKALALTPAGTMIVERARREWERVQQAFQGAFGAKRWDEFLAMLDEIRQHFEIDPDPPARTSDSRAPRRRRGTRRRQE